MAKVTSKRQITIPKVLADRFRIREGDEIAFVAGDDAIRLVPAAAAREPLTVAERLALFDAATRRQAARQKGVRRAAREPQSRGWTRSEVYDGRGSR